MTFMSTCYIVNFYLGERRRTVEEYQINRLCFLEKQIEVLEKYSHRLRKIVFSFNMEKDHFKYVSEIFRLVPKYIQGAEVEVYFRENEGLSYGAWSDSFERNRDSFDHFIFNEDDYFFVQNGWDSYLVDKFNSYPDAGYVCAVAREPDEWNDYKKHAGHSTCISSRKVLSEIFDKYGMLPHGSGGEYRMNEREGQIEQSFSALRLGYNMYDIRDDYRVAFGWTVPGEAEILRFFWWNDKDLIQPARILMNDTPYHFYESHHLEFLKEFKSSTYDEALLMYEQKVNYEIFMQERYQK